MGRIDLSISLSGSVTRRMVCCDPTEAPALAALELLALPALAALETIGRIWRDVDRPRASRASGRAQQRG